MYLSMAGGNVSFGEKTVLEDVHFEIREKQKIAVVGRNGCGKSTLLKLISDDLSDTGADSTVCLSKTDSAEIGYLKQMAFDDDSVTLESEVYKAFAAVIDLKNEAEQLLKKIGNDPTGQAADRYREVTERAKLLGGDDCRKEYELMLKKFGFSFEDRHKRLSEFSGGQRTKIAFMRLLLSKPDVLLLDEPTNHLDMETVEWLEGYLKNYPQAVVVVSHDQMFLDRVVQVVYEIERHKIKRYSGNYSTFLQQKREQIKKQQKDYEAYLKEQQRLEKTVERFRYKATKAAMAQSKIKAMERMEKVEAPVCADTRSFYADLTPLLESGGTVLTAHELVVGYEKPLFTADFVLQKGQKMGIIGPNGVGKSTLLKTLCGKLLKKGGQYVYGVNVQVGYFDQQMAQYVSDKTVLDDYWDTFPSLTQTQARNDLGSFVFRGEDVFKPVNVLSGGEKVRLCLCKILKRRPNLLILDEPTNHMDIVGKQALEDMLSRYEGTLLCVSHDRYFIKEICDSLLYVEPGKATVFPFGFEEYEARRQTPNKPDRSPVKKAPGVTEKERAPKNQSPLKELGKVTTRIRKLEETVALCEEEIAGIQAEMNDPEIASDYEAVLNLSGECEEKEAALSGYMDEWETLCARKEELEAIIGR